MNNGKNNENVLFVCETKAQLFNAILLKKRKLIGEKIDICLCDNGVNQLSQFKIALVQNELFKNVFVYKTGHDVNQSLIGIGKRALRNLGLVKKIGESLPNRNNNYNKIFISGPSSSVNAVYYYFKNKNSRLELCLYEEGIYEYYMLSSKKNILRRIYSRIVYGRYYLDDAKKIYVYAPELVLGNTKNINIDNIPKLSFRDGEMKRILNSVFKFELHEIETLKNRKYIFIEQAFPCASENTQQKQIIKQIINIVGENKIIIKLHPNSDINKYSGLNVKCIKTNQTMEMLELNLNIDEPKLISICSSAVFNFDLIFESSPSIILLYKLFESTTIDKQLYNFIRQFSQKRKNSKVAIPYTIEELKICLKNSG